MKFNLTNSNRKFSIVLGLILRIFKILEIRHGRVCIRGVRKVIFSENFANVLNERPPSDRRLIQNEIGQIFTFH